MNKPGPDQQLQCRSPRSWRAIAWTLLSSVAWLTACGGGGGSGEGSPASAGPPTPTALALPAPAGGEGTMVQILSTSGDAMGGGTARTYTQINAGIELQVLGSVLRLVVRGDEFWTANIRTAADSIRVVEGQHVGLTQIDDAESPRVGMRWEREFVRCSGWEGMFSVDRVRYVGTELSEVELRIAQRCTGSLGIFQARVRWVAADQPPRPAAPPVPAGLWQPAAGQVAATGNLIYIESSGAEAVFGGRTKTFTEDNAGLSVAAAGDQIDITVREFDQWHAKVFGIQRAGGLRPGFYEQLRGNVGYHNPARGMLEWYRAIASCPKTRSWMALDRLEYERGALKALTFRFEQRCLESTGVIRGLVRWDADQRRLPPPPLPAPAGLWAPPAADVPASGNHLLLYSEPGDWIGGGVTTRFTSATARFLAFDVQGKLTLRVAVLENSQLPWEIEVSSRATVRRAEAGYRALGPGQGANPAMGMLRVGSPGRGCDPGERWYVIDEISHRHGVLRHIALRFEHRCAGSGAALRGSLRWSSDEPTIALGAADPPSPEPVLPPALEMPATGTAFLLQSRGREPLGRGLDWLYTPRDGLVLAETVNLSPAHFFSFFGQDDWRGEIWPPTGQSRLQAGRWPIAKLTAGTRVDPSFEVSGLSRGCDTVEGWFEIDDIAYSGDQLTRLALRFEQFCDGLPYPLLGQFRWSLADSTPVVRQPEPVPADLWAPPAGAMPPGPIAAYLQSSMGAFVGGGETFPIQGTPETVVMVQRGSETSIRYVPRWDLYVDLSLKPAVGEPQLQAGYYSLLSKTYRSDAVLAAASFASNGRTCNMKDGWLAVDEIAYDASGLLSIAARMMQRCHEDGVPEFLAFRWVRP